MIDGVRDLRSIAAELNRDEFDTAKVVYGLATTGVVEIRQRRLSTTIPVAAVAPSEDPELASKIDQIVQAFSGETAGELELQSTIIFVDREQAREQQLPTEEFITDRVHSIKPHFPKSVILARIKTMKAQGYMLSLSA